MGFCTHLSVALTLCPSLVRCSLLWIKNRLKIQSAHRKSKYQTVQIKVYSFFELRWNGEKPQFLLTLCAHCFDVPFFMSLVSPFYRIVIYHNLNESIFYHFNFIHTRMFGSLQILAMAIYYNKAKCSAKSISVVFHTNIEIMKLLSKIKFSFNLIDIETHTHTPTHTRHKI